MRILFMILFSGIIYAQNLVQNPSFELYSSCPNASEQIDRANNWQRPPNTTGSPDYYNSCNTQYQGVPSNIHGNQPAFEGNAYVGIVIYYDFPTVLTNYREYIQTQLASPLVAGQTYQVSFYVSLGDNIRLASNNIGAVFTVNQLSGNGDNQPISITPAIFQQSIISNSSGWTEITGTYLATGNERFLTIGNFFSNDETQIEIANPAWGFTQSYYYIDNVNVSPFLAIENFEGQMIKAYPNPADTLLTIETATEIIDTIKLFDVQGKEIISTKVDATTYRLDISNFQKGVYLINILTGSQTKNMKFVKL